MDPESPARHPTRGPGLLTSGATRTQGFVRHQGAVPTPEVLHAFPHQMGIAAAWRVPLCVGRADIGRGMEMPPPRSPGPGQALGGAHSRLRDHPPSLA